MARPAGITIGRQVLEVALHGSEAEGLALQRRLPGVCADVVTPALETALGEVDPGDDHLSIDTMVIELPDVGLDRLETELAEAVRRAVADHFRSNPPVPAGDGAAAGDGAVVRRTVAEDIDDALVTFLRTGRLPWSFALPSGSRLEEVVLASWATAGGDRGPPPATRRRLREVLAEPHARARLARQLTPEPAATIIGALSPGLATPLAEVLRALDRLTGIDHAKATFRVRLWEVAVAAASAGHPTTPADLVHAAWAASPPDERRGPALVAALEHRWPGSTARPGDADRGRIAGEPSSPVPGSTPTTARTSAAEATPAAAPASASAALGDEDDLLVVDHAGIVLLHPFLARFLAGLAVSDGDVLVAPDRGVALLHLLATGERHAPEHQLVVAKVLCGLPLDVPVAADVGLTDAEDDEATALLAAAIGHWEALRGTSPDALRAEFLRRPGTLAVDDDGDWLLRVEERGVDVLLDQLPWGTSIVALPWMSRLLRVEWR